jgi:hypothetical protein
VTEFEHVWDRIRRHSGAQFLTATGLPFTYRVPGDYLRVSRDGVEINRSLSKSNFLEAVQQMPAERPSQIKDRQGSAYTWAILMDPRIRRSEW